MSTKTAKRQKTVQSKIKYIYVEGTNSPTTCVQIISAALQQWAPRFLQNTHLAHLEWREKRYFIIGLNCSPSESPSSEVINQLRLVGSSLSTPRVPSLPRHLLFIQQPFNSAILTNVCLKSNKAAKQCDWGYYLRVLSLFKKIKTTRCLLLVWHTKIFTMTNNIVLDFAHLVEQTKTFGTSIFYFTFLMFYTLNN